VVEERDQVGLLIQMFPVNPVYPINKKYIININLNPEHFGPSTLSNVSKNGLIVITNLLFIVFLRPFSFKWALLEQLISSWAGDQEVAGLNLDWTATIF
jgi:hypothetical protein